MEADHLYLLVERDGGSAEIAWVTDITVDLTYINKLYIDWENIGLDSINANASFIASTNKDVFYNTFDARLLLTNNFSRRVSELDVSMLSGNLYIRVHGRDISVAPIKVEIKVYRVWGNRDDYRHK